MGGKFSYLDAQQKIGTTAGGCSFLAKLPFLNDSKGAARHTRRECRDAW